MTPLMLALQKKYAKDVIYELVNGSAINAVSDDGKTALIYAIENYYDKDIISELIMRGADVNYRCKGMTPLFFAVQFHCTYEIIKVLVDAGAVGNVLDNHGRNVLMIIPWDNCEVDECKYKSIIDLLVKSGVDLKTVDDNGNTVMHSVNCYYLMGLAKETGVFVETENSVGQTPLGRATLCNGIAIKNLLLHDANPNCCILYKTPLHYCDRLSIENIEALLYHGGDLEAKNLVTNRTAFDANLRNFEEESGVHEDDLKVLTLIRHYLLFVNENGLTNSFNMFCDYRRDFFPSFVRRCQEELIKMRYTFITHNLTFYDFCLLKKCYRSNYVHISINDYKYNFEQISEMFKIFHKEIITRIKDNLRLEFNGFLNTFSKHCVSSPLIL